MAWLPGHTCVWSLVDVADEQRMPSRFTTAPHIFWPWKRPPASPPVPGAAISNVLSVEAVGRSAHGSPPCPKHGTVKTPRTTARLDTLFFIRFIEILLARLDFWIRARYQYTQVVI